MKGGRRRGVSASNAEDGCEGGCVSESLTTLSVVVVVEGGTAGTR